jgi:hypothetical protein
MVTTTHRYAATKEALGGDDRKMVDLCLTMGCYSAVSNLLNMFEIPLPEGAVRLNGCTMDSSTSL